MKFRCVTDSLRFRLRKSDIEILKREGSIWDSIAFPNEQRFVFGISLVEGGDLKAVFDNNTITINLPKKMADDWIASDQVSWAFSLPANSGKQLSVLIEKDFPCKHTGADFEDTFYELQPEELKMFRKK